MNQYQTCLRCLDIRRHVDISAYRSLARIPRSQSFGRTHGHVSSYDRYDIDYFDDEYYDDGNHHFGDDRWDAEDSH